jgi:hypothetical protein
MQLLIEIVPDMKRVGVLFNPNIRAPPPKCAERRTQYARSACNSTSSRPTLPRNLRAHSHAYERRKSKLEHRERIAKLAQKAGLAIALQRRENVEAGGVLSYGSNLTSQFRQTAF